MAPKCSAASACNQANAPRNYIENDIDFDDENEFEVEYEDEFEFD